MVMDTNSLVAARWKRSGSSSALMELCIEGCVRALVTRQIESENRSILKKVKPPAGYWKMLECFYDSAEVVTELPTIRLADDAEDDKYLECAVGGNADYVISSDRHLLVHDGFRGIRVCKSHEFFRENPELEVVVERK